MTPDPFIRDAAFRGSPIMSYGRASRGPVWPKYLALGAGFFVLFLIILFSLFWFLTKIPVPKEAAAVIIFPADKPLDATNPLLWKQSHEYNKPLPTIAGLVRDRDNNFLEYSIRLSPLNAITGKSRLWKLEASQELLVKEYKSPFQFFGWPWELRGQKVFLELNTNILLSNVTQNNTDSSIRGTVVGNRWRTDFPLFMAGDKSIEGKSNAVLLEDGDLDILNNFFAYHGVFVSDNSTSGTLSWDFGSDAAIVKYTDITDLDLIRDNVESNGVEYKVFTMPDGTTARVIYATSGNLGASTGDVTINTEGLLLDQNKESVSDLTCSGEVIAVLNRMSLQNFCSWFDICLFDFNNLVFLNEDGYLTVCGY